MARILSAPDIARIIGVRAPTARTWIRKGIIKATRVDNGLKQPRYADEAALRSQMKKLKEEKKKAAQPTSRPSRAGRISQRRQEKIDELFKILKNQLPVSASDKELALQYWICLYEINQRRPYFAGFMRDPHLPPIPLLEGVHAIYEGYLKFGYVPEAFHELEPDFESAIEQLPTKLQTERPSLNASAQ